ncbi:glucose/galactose MFS transporter [Algivirga pacifica]|uniref:MFS transporter n=1 Tax=Algivirga pacifica TaxID=1162670 RepID=A0ABP9D904_9BACT
MKPNASNNRKNYMVPFATMVFIFFLVGFLTVVNQQFQAPLKNVFDLDYTQTTLLTFTFFLAYPVMGTPSAKMIDKFGYKKTTLIALLILAVAMLCFLGAAYFQSYSIFLVGSFITGASLTVLQTVVNPYLAVLGKPEGASTRLNIASGFNSLGTVLAPQFVSIVVFGGAAATQVESVYVPYIVLTVLILLLVLVIKALTLPEIEGTTQQQGEVRTGSAWQFRHLVLGVIALFCYVGAEVSVGANFNLYMEKDMGFPEKSQQVVNMVSLYWGGLMVGRFISGFGLSKVRNDIQLKVASSIALVLCLAGMFGSGIENTKAIAPWLFVGMGLFHSIMWPCIFTLAIDGLGIYTSQGSGLLMIGVFGGAVLPFFQGVFADMLGGFQWTFWIVIAAEAYILFYAIAGHKNPLKKKVDE